MKLLLTCGGTGGHISPALSVAELWKQKGGDVLIAGNFEEVGRDLIDSEEYRIRSIPAAPLPRRLSIRLLKSLGVNLTGMWRARKIIKKFEPHVVLGTGGYASGAVVLTASLLGYPAAIHEQNSYPGLANRLLARHSDLIAISYSESKKYFKDKFRKRIEHTGNPIRQSITEVDRHEARDKLNIPQSNFAVLVMGGSQGAAVINKALISAYEKLTSLDDFYAIHITGKNNYEYMIEKAGKNLSSSARRKIEFISFCDEMEYPLAAADLFVGRAGATTLAEITASSLPAILIPYPHAAADHQLQNARVLSECGAASLLEESSLSPGSIEDEISYLYHNEKLLQQMSLHSGELGFPRAAENIVRLLQNLAEGEESYGDIRN